MAITPSGAPAWVVTNDHTTYGGNVNKRNYQSENTVNPQTDVGADEFCRIVADLAAVIRVTPFAIVSFTCNDGSPAAPTVNYYSAMAGSAPSGVRNGNGDVTFTWDASYTDPYSVSGDIHIGHCIAMPVVSGQFGTAVASDVDVNGKNEVVRVRAYNAAGAAQSDATVTLIVWCTAV